MSISASLTTLYISLKQVFRPKTTEEFPWKAERPRAERYRASFALTHDEHGDEACIGCKMCEEICPSGIITVTAAPKAVSPNTGKKRGWHDDFTIDVNACIVCELCVQVCPTDSIVMLRIPEAPGYDRSDLVLTKEKLYANEKLARASWATGSKLVEMQAPPKAEPPAKKAAAAAEGSDEKPKPTRKPAPRAAEAAPVAPDEPAPAAPAPAEPAPVEPKASAAPPAPPSEPAQDQSYADDAPTIQMDAETVRQALHAARAEAERGDAAPEPSVAGRLATKLGKDELDPPSVTPEDLARRPASTDDDGKPARLAQDQAGPATGADLPEPAHLPAGTGTASPPEPAPSTEDEP